MRRLLACLVLAAAACSGGDHRTTFPPAPPAETEAALAGSRCQGTRCTCRAGGADDAEETPPAEGQKRFEVRVGTGPGTAWVTFDGAQRLYKSSERAEECFYLDLAPGQHEVTVRGKAAEPQGGVGVELRISEHNPKGPWWYDTFRFQCGFPGPCAAENLRSWKREVEAFRRNLRDPCGSTKVLGITWETGRMPDSEHPEELSMKFVLDVRDFAPEHAPGDPSCAER